MPPCPTRQSVKQIPDPFSTPTHHRPWGGVFDVLHAQRSASTGPGPPRAFPTFYCHTGFARQICLRHRPIYYYYYVLCSSPRQRRFLDWVAANVCRPPPLSLLSRRKRSRASVFLFGVNRCRHTGTWSSTTKQTTPGHREGWNEPSPPPTPNVCLKFYTSHLVLQKQQSDSHLATSNRSSNR
jgi:hypothetical protein